MSAQDLVLVPGLGSDAAVWRHTIRALGDEMECLVGDTLSDGSLAGMARRILDRAPPRFGLAGVSMGGMVALEMVRIAPERVSWLALVDTSVRPDTWKRWLMRHVANGVVGRTRDFARLAERSLGSLVHDSAPPAIREELVAMSVRVGARAYVRQNRAVLARGDLRPILPGIAVPTAVIVGQEDRMTPVADSRAIHALVPGSTIQVIPACGHLPPIERPEIVADALRALSRRT